MHGPRGHRLWPEERGCVPEAPSPRPVRCTCRRRAGCTADGQALVRPGTDGWGSVPRPNGSILRMMAGGKKGTHGGRAVDRPPRVPVADELLHLLRRVLHPGSTLWLSPESGPGAGEWVGMYLARLPAPVIRRGRSLLVPHCGCYRADRPGTVNVGCRQK